ncbi:rhomboid family intramembrane serine protease [Heyndrickxia vini]|uniref:Rhomboid family intramembrane serine protease n=1 Tax=Heyndrickxia vini TaxID=1476025 RepID=A0ABX7E6A4_9BACI|nr:rhomboid family intramembrane serine protease [Heyndrickxia vini]QQZ10860.1 rhomboid family intramembrane serine protease [Heyndrickxia vini]
MSNREDYLFWKLAQILITDKGYSLMHISEDHNELWLEDTANKHAQVIRLLRNDLDWGKKLQRDVHHTAVQAENIRKHLMKRQLNVLNIYVSMHLPVDEFESYIQRPIQVNKKTLLHSAIIDQENVNTGITYLEKLLNDEIIIHLNDEYEDQDVAELKSAVITNVVSKTKQEQQFFDNGKPFFTYVFLAIQIAMFILLEMTGGSNNQENLIRYGAKFNPLILEGEWWRFITPIFLHIGFLHILMNSLALFYLGPTVEKIFGRIRFVWIYLFSGFAGVLASFLFSSHLSAGASGAIFGCFGALLYIGAANPKLFFRTMGMNVIIVIIINLVFGFSVSGIDNYGHLGGLVGGFLAAAVVHFPKQHRWFTQIGAFLLTAIVTGSLLFMGFNNESPEVIHGLAQQKLNDENYEEAYKLFNQLVEKGKGDAVTYFQLSYTEIQLQKLEKAKEHLQKTIELDPKFHQAYYNLALLYANEGDLTKAKELVQKALKLSNDKKYEDLLNKMNDAS